MPAEAGPLAKCGIPLDNSCSPLRIVACESAAPWYDEVVERPIRMVEGHWQVPEAPGLGIAVNEKACAVHPFAPEIQLAVAQAILGDGTVVDG